MSFPVLELFGAKRRSFHCGGHDERKTIQRKKERKRRGDRERERKKSIELRFIAQTMNSIQPRTLRNDSSKLASQVESLKKKKTNHHHPAGKKSNIYLVNTSTSLSLRPAHYWHSLSLQREKKKNLPIMVQGGGGKQLLRYARWHAYGLSLCMHNASGKFLSPLLLSALDYSF